jgi:hypothetical protein
MAVTFAPKTTEPGAAGARLVGELKVTEKFSSPSPIKSSVIGI